MKKVWIYQILYYILVPVVYFVTVWILNELFDRIANDDDLGTALAFIFGIMFFVTPVVIGCMMRLSLLRWIVDPFAAAEVPVLWYLAMLRKELLRGSTATALNESLGWGGFVFLTAIFLVGLICSISRKRVEGDNLVYRILNR